MSPVPIIDKNRLSTGTYICIFRKEKIKKLYSVFEKKSSFFRISAFSRKQFVLSLITIYNWNTVESDI
jgi:hypothetical protein